MNELQLKYGCNPNQKPSRIFMADGSDLPVEVLCGRPGYINFLDALNGFQLVRELKEATGLPAATSFKHVSPAGGAAGRPLSAVERKMYFVGSRELTPLACAYARARGADRMSSFGDFIALSDPCDEATAHLISMEVSDGVIAPDYTPEALEILKAKRKGAYNVIRIDPAYRPDPIERKQVYGVTFEQGRNELKIDREMFQNIVSQNKTLPEEALVDLMIAMITLKYTQSNSVCYVYNGQAIGICAASRAASTARAWRAARRTTGSCASTPRSSACSSRRAWAAPTATTPSTCTSGRSGRTCSATTSGRTPSPCARSR